MNQSTLHHHDDRIDATHDAGHEPAEHEHHEDHDHDQSSGEHDGERDDEDGHHRASDELRKLLSDADWDDLTKRLIAYANWRLGFFYSARSSGNAAEDYAQRTVELLLEGKRHYTPSSNLPFYGFLCGVVDSLVSHDAEKVQRRAKRGVGEVPISEQEGDGDREDQVSEANVRDAVEFEPEIIARDRFERFASELDPDLAAYARLRVNEPGLTAEEYARALGTTVPAIRNMDRQLRRRKTHYLACGQRPQFRVLAVAS